MSLLLITISLVMAIPARGQPTTCPDGSTGYGNIAAINHDINAEVARIKAGGTPQSVYLYRLCPNTKFVISGNTQLDPLLDGSVFQCGNNGNPTDNCQISGGVNQVNIGPSAMSGYTIKNIDFKGVSFTDFSGAAISGNATGTTTVTLDNVNIFVSTHRNDGCAAANRQSRTHIFITVPFNRVLIPTRLFHRSRQILGDLFHSNWLVELSHQVRVVLYFQMMEEVFR